MRSEGIGNGVCIVAKSCGHAQKYFLVRREKGGEKRAFFFVGSVKIVGWCVGERLDRFILARVAISPALNYGPRRSFTGHPCLAGRV